MVKRVATFVSAAGVLLAMASSASGQTADVGRALVVSNNLKLSMDTTRSGAGPVRVKAFVVPYGGKVRLKWELKSDGVHNASAFGISQIQTCESPPTQAATFQSFTCDVRVVEGDIVEVWVQGEFDTNTFMFSPVSIRRVRVFYDVVNATGHGKVLMD